MPITLGFGLTAFAGALGALQAVGLAVSCSFYRKQAGEGPLGPMTVIRPLRGAEPGLYENLASIVRADTENALQVLFAMEDREDPAYAVARRVVREFPSHDLEIVITGPSRDRMGKAHNMIESIQRAKHEQILFVDSDVRAGRTALQATSDAFLAGADAASAMPDASANSSPTDALIGVCFNHYFVASAALFYRLGVITPMAGGWLACRKSFIDRLGGLESLADQAAEDIAIAMGARRLGAKAVLLPVMVPIFEHGGNPSELARHVLKWAKIIRFSALGSYALLPLLDLMLIACLAWLTGASWLVPLSAALWRMATACIQDRRTAGGLFPAWIYPSLPLLDLACVGIWVASYCSNTIDWRGKKYRLFPGGRLEVLSK